jgi:CheY-like chemotaxis protein
VDAPQQGDADLPLVLLVEDDRDVAYVVRLLLEDEGYRVEWRDDGRAGLDAANQLRPDVLILDLRLPGFPGPQVMRALKAAPETRRIPVIVLSAVADRLDPALRKEAAAVLHKPTDASELFSAVRAALDGAAAGDLADDHGRETAEPGC